MEKETYYLRFFKSSDYSLFKFIIEDIVKEKTEALLRSIEDKDILRLKIEINAIKALQDSIENTVNSLDLTEEELEKD